MFRSVSLLAIAGFAYAATPVSFQTHYISLGPQDTSTAIAADSAGDIFIVSNLTVNSGQPAIRATKTDPQGNVIGSFDFGVNSHANAAAVDSEGNLLVAGSTEGSFDRLVQETEASGLVVRLDSGLTRVMASATLGTGASGSTFATAVTTDRAGSVYVTGGTWAYDFPVTPGAFQTTPPQGLASGPPPFAPVFAFVTKFTEDLSGMIYSTYFGNDRLGCVYGDACHNDSAATTATAIAVDAQGIVTIAGSSNSPLLVEGLSGGYNGYDNPAFGFLARFSPDGGTLVAFLALGPAGIAAQAVQAMAVDPAGNLLLAGGANVPPGWFGSAPIQSGIAVPYSGNESGGFLAKYDAALQNLVWGTFFGANDVNGVALDNDGDVWIAGSAQISTLPGVNSTSTQTSSYIAEISADGSSLLNLTLSQQLGGGAIVSTQGGSLAVLGPADSFLLSGPPDQPSFLTVTSSANNVSSGTIAPVELISLYGSGIGPATAIAGQVVNGAYTSNLGGYQVAFNGIPGPLLYAGPNQFNVVAPAAIAGQPTAQISVTGPQGSTTFPTVFVAAVRPQLFPIAINPDGTVNSSKNPAKGAVTLWATGTGLAGGQRLDGSTTPVAPPYQTFPITATNLYNTEVPVAVTYAGDAPGAILGLTQINLQISASGPIAVQLGGVTSSGAFVYATAP